LAILPMIASFEFGPQVAANPIVVGIWLVLVGGTMVSRLPTFSFKKLKIPQSYVLAVLVAAGLVVAGLASAPWRTLLVVGIVYLATIPFASISYMRLRREAERLHDDSDDDSDEDDGGDTGDAGEAGKPAPHLRPV
jgi:CDP-diacylglycerol--serine O-phosphatidyltransferase